MPTPFVAFSRMTPGIILVIIFIIPSLAEARPFEFLIRSELHFYLGPYYCRGAVTISIMSFSIMTLSKSAEYLCEFSTSQMEWGVRKKA